jgi:hypothetical protein
MSVKELATFRRAGTGLMPASVEARALIASLDAGETVLVERRNPRNMAAHRAYFAMLGNVVQATGKWPSVESLSWDLSVALKRGVVETSPVSNKVRWVPDSRAVSAMPKADFERLHSDTVALLIEWLDFHPDDLRDAA